MQQTSEFCALGVGLISSLDLMPQGDSATAEVQHHYIQASKPNLRSLYWGQYSNLETQQRAIVPVFSDLTLNDVYIHGTAPP